MNAVELKDISKAFGGILANDGIDLTVKEGEIHCILGENGAGKTTLMKILFGLYSKDSGRILIKGQEVEIKEPRQAINLGIGMIHQHFMLVNRLTVAENIIAGDEPLKGIFIDQERANSEVEKLSQRYNLKVNPAARIENISVGEQQRVEILKALYRNAEILILDEPTAVLTPQETEELFQVMRKLKRNGKTIIFITHKLKETMTISDRVTILRDGRKVGTVTTSETSPEELARMMVGREVVLRVDKKARKLDRPIFEVRGLSLHNKKSNLYLKDISFTIEKGEILGVAGVEGNGQLELEEALTALRKIEQGQIILKGRDITGLRTRERRDFGLAHIPSDRLKRGLIEEFNLERNLILGSEWQEPFARRGFLVKRAIQAYAKRIIKEFDIRTSGSQAKAADLSGGNQQKVILGRELMRDPDLIIASQPTRGVDVGAIEYIHNLLLEMRDRGKGILLISAELDELRSLSDRIMVIYEGTIVAEGKTEDFTEEELGLLMAGQGLEGVG
ncbi:MAG: ral nucleoside transport system ATP-binding protein [Halanaerobiales bacterium]|nr:ral nucleoside transport system ATP-binding protein [Halanaerobiales bacterium]